MTTKINFIPEGNHQLTPYLYINGAADAIEFYKKAFGAVELMRMEVPGGKIGHAEIKIGTAIIMMADEFPDMGVLGPKTIGGSPVTLHLYVEDVDATFQKALEIGAVSIKEPQDQFYGDRSGCVRDSFGNFWGIATHIEDVSEEEIQKRLSAAAG